MAGQDKRVIEQQATSEVFADDWFLKDSVTEGTTKISSENLKAWINDGMATEEEIETIVENIADIYSTSESYAEGDLCIHEYALFKCTGTTTGTWDSTKWQATTVAELLDSIDLSAEAISYDNTSSGLEAENVQDAIDAVETALETKAEQNGIYDDLVAGNLLSDSYTADNAPYLYRQSPSASSVSQNIVGGTVAWNQFCKNSSSVTCPAEQNSPMTIDTNIPFVSGHKYLFGWKQNNSVSSIMRNGPYFNDGENHYYNNLTGIKSAGTYYWVTPATGTTSTGTLTYWCHTPDVAVTYSNFMIIDLTQMFGSTIADYIYSLEQTTAGSGIAWLKSYGFLTKDYYTYDSGSLQSVKTSGRKIVGFNQWDEKWQIGDIDGNTGAIKTGNYLISKNYIRVFPNTNYYIKTPTYLYMYKYDASKNVIGYQPIISSGVITIDVNTHYILFRNNISDASQTYNNDICINISDASKNGQYEPYTTHTYPTSPIDLRGLFKLSNGNLVADGDVYSADGSVTRRFGIVDLGTLTWAIQSGQASVFYAYPTNYKVNTNNTVCSKYERKNSGSTISDKQYVSVNNQIYISDSNYTDATAFKTAMNGVYLVYELSTPTTESADAYENPQLVGSTEEFIDTRDVPIPVGGERKYHTDLKAKLEELAKIPDVPSANGTYTLKATRSASGVTYNWVSG